MKTDSVADDASDGGVGGSRLEHTWTDGTNSGTGLDTLLFLLILITVLIQA